MRVLLTGATGYIGSAVAEALRAAGHVVAGVVRSEEKAKLLESKGFDVVHADLAEPDKLAGAARESHGVIHTAFAFGPDTARLDEGAVEAMLGALEGTGKPFVYTSGVWLIGDTGGRVAGEMAPLNPPGFVAWRAAVERRVLDAGERKVRGVVIRPAMVYGRGGGSVAGFIYSAKKWGAARAVGDGNNHWSFVHIDDLARLYVLALEKSGAGELYLAADGPALKVREVAEAASKAAGAGGKVEFMMVEEARKSLGVIADGLVLDQKIGSTKAGRLLGWIAEGSPVLEEIARGSYAPAAERA